MVSIAITISAELNPATLWDHPKRRVFMNHKAAKLLVVVESDDALRNHIVGVLSDAGYEVSTNYQLP